jgi:hypothetical protein
MSVIGIDHVQLAMPVGANDLERIVERCLELGLNVVDEPLEGYQRVYVHDPFGNRLELMQRNRSG